jgi:L1 cell adhesion molecule like protein
MGEKTTPSIVTIIDDKTILVGEETLEYLVKDYDSSIYAIKRFIGREYNDSSVKNEIDKENFPFKIIGEGQSKKIPKVEVKKDNKLIKFTLEEISSFIIKKMVDNAEAFLGKKVKKLVITVPANFNDAQRNCTKQAAKLAGIEVLRIINEPTAAALAYGLGENNDQIDKNILVFDLGGGTFDVTILRINKSEEINFEILSTNGDKFLGGEDFDNKLVEYVLDDFCQKHNESKEKIKQNKKIIRKLKINCKIIKKTLSTNYQTTLCINNFYNGQSILKIIKKK